MSEAFDFIVIGGGIAGASVAYELGAHGTVCLVEKESQPGYHSTGRSAAVMSENYGSPIWSRLVTASRGFLENPPDGFSSHPLLTDRGALFLAAEGEQAALEAQGDDMAARNAGFAVMSPVEARHYCPIIRPEAFALALYEPGCRDIDTNALLHGYLRGLIRRQGRVLLDRAVHAIDRDGDGWRLSVGSDALSGAIVVNAAGAWARDIARLAVLGPRNVVPFRRTAVTVDAPSGRDASGSDASTWPMTFDVAETFYFKPESGGIMVSPVDMAISDPCDAQADEMEVAIAIDRLQRFTTLQVSRVRNRWGGLRTFAPDHAPVIGPDPEQPGFIWLAGQGGNGVMAGPAAARIAASLATGAGLPEDLRLLGLKADDLSPARAAVVDPDREDTAPVDIAALVAG